MGGGVGFVGIGVGGGVASNSSPGFATTGVERKARSTLTDNKSMFRFFCAGGHNCTPLIE